MKKQKRLKVKTKLRAGWGGCPYGSHKIGEDALGIDICVSP